MYLRQESGKTLELLRNELEDNTEQQVQLVARDIRVDMLDNREIILPTSTGEIEVPLTSDGIKALGDWLDIPNAYLRRWGQTDQEFAQVLLQRHLLHTPSTVNVVFSTEHGIKELRDPNHRHIDSRRLVDIAMNVIDPAAPVVDYRKEVGEFGFDVTAPDGFDRGIGGDPRVGDITRGGLRFGQDLKRNLAPHVQPFMYRLRCTNGQEGRDDGLRVDARGQSVEEVLAELEAAAERAFSRVEQDIASFYALRDEPVENPERTLVRVASERGIPDRTVVQMVERVPAMELANEEAGPTMFDIVNLITNTANDPTISRRANSRRMLEQAGGAIVTEHVDRCRACQSRLA